MAPIAPEEQARRQEAIDWARHSIGLSGFTLSDEAEALFARYVQGEMNRDKLNAAVLVLAGLKDQ